MVCITPGGRFFRLGIDSAAFLHFAERLAVEFDLEVDVAQPVVAVDFGRAAGHADARDVGEHHRTVLAGHCHAFEQRKIGSRRRRQPDDDGHLPLRQVQLRQPLIVIAGGGDAQGFGDGGRGHAQVGHAGKVGPYHQFRANQAGGRGDVADARNPSQIALDLARVLGKQRAVLAASTSTYFSLPPPSPTLTSTPGITLSAVRKRRSMACLLTPPRSLRGVRFRVSVALRTSACPLRTERVAAGPPAANRRIDQPHIRIAGNDGRARSAVASVSLNGVPGGSDR